VSTRRLLKAAAAVREVVSMAILTEVRDPRVRDVTVTRVEMAPDMRGAIVHVSVMGTPAQTRYTPRLRFELDGGVKHALDISRVLDSVLPDSDQDGDPATPSESHAAPAREEP
jgi:ribosome-binding factor A